MNLFSIFLTICYSPIIQATSLTTSNCYPVTILGGADSALAWSRLLLMSIICIWITILLIIICLAYDQTQLAFSQAMKPVIGQQLAILSKSQRKRLLDLIEGSYDKIPESLSNPPITMLCNNLSFACNWQYFPRASDFLTLFRVLTIKSPNRWSFNHGML